MVVNEEPSISPKTKLMNKKSMAEIVGMLNQNLYKHQDEKQVKEAYEKYRMADISFGIAALIPLCLTAAASDIEFYEGSSALLTLLLSLIFGITILSIFINIFRYNQELKYLKAINAVPQDTDLHSHGRVWYLIAEIFILLLIPYPWTVNVQVPGYDEDDGFMFYYTLNDMFAVLIMLRVFFIIRMILHLTSYMSPSVVRLSCFFGTKNGYTYACKCLLQRYPLACVTINYFASMMIFAYMLRICERPLSKDPDYTMLVTNYWNALWWAIATMTTVGYGDFYAITNFGRLVSFFCCTWGAVIISVMVVVLTSVLEMSPSEKKILIIVQRLQAKRKLEIKAANLITSVYRVILNNAKRSTATSETNELQMKELAHKMEKNLEKFRKANDKYKRFHDRDNTNEEMARQFEFMRHEMREIKQAVTDLSGILQPKPKEVDVPKLPSSSKKHRRQESHPM